LTVTFAVPAHNAASTLPLTIASLRRAQPPGSEIVVVDDGSLDDTQQVAESLVGAQHVVRRPCQGGAARARNDAARIATNDVLFFVDADVTVTPEAVAGALRHLDEGADAVFGAYTALPPEGYRNAATTFKNLIHHFTHHESATDDARTFWSGFGAVRRDAFERVHGFDPAVTRSADVEDIHLGYRLHNAGYRIVLDPALEVSHHKGYGTKTLILSDVFHRAIPWARAMVQLRRFDRDLNLKGLSIASCVFVWAFVAALLAVPFVPLAAATVAFAALVAWLFANARFITYSKRVAGVATAMKNAGYLALCGIYAPLGAAGGLVIASMRPPHHSIRNSLGLSLLDAAPTGVLATVALVSSVAGGATAVLDALPPVDDVTELLVVGTAEPDRLPKGTRFVAVPPGTNPAAMRQVALDHARGEVIALLDERTIPTPGWLDRVRAAATRRDLAVGGSFAPADRSPRALAAFLPSWWTWRRTARATYTEDHPPTNIVLQVAAARRLGGFSEPALLLRRMSGFGARPVRFDPEMHVLLSTPYAAIPLAGMFRSGRHSASALVRAYDNRRRLRLMRVLVTPFHTAAHVARVMIVTARDREWSIGVLLAMPRAALSVAAHDLGSVTGYVRPVYPRFATDGYEEAVLTAYAAAHVSSDPVGT
jgi:GT2 family glycosyltransferase